jgi:PAS domain S-box-containing protein/putative nucleotidyltransferase with HDIG domain
MDKPLYPRVSGWPRLGGRETCALAFALFLVIFLARASDPHTANAEGVLYVLPVSVLALRYGVRGGLLGALVAALLVLSWDLHEGTMSVLGIVSRDLAFVTVGGLVGLSIDRHRRLETEISAYYEASLDLLATADLKGNLIRVNRAWERTLGHSAETMCSRPFIDFVHPEDREATIAEASALAEGRRESIHFRNRYRTADGEFRWLEWNATVSLRDGVIHAVVRDITASYKAERQVANSARRLQEKVAERTYELEQARAETLTLIAVVAEYRDEDTSQHTQRVGEMAAEIALHLGMDSERVKQLRDAARLHDVGKIAIPDRILLNPGKLSAQEAELMRTHAALGAVLLRRTSSPVLQMASTIAASHHEWWDGTGYPAGLAGERIPLVGRIVAVADVFDALTHDRPYKAAWPIKRAIDRIARGAGSQFDPRVVSAFLEVVQDALPSRAVGHDGRSRAPGGGRLDLARRPLNAPPA